MLDRRVVTKVDNFDYPFTPTTTPTGHFGWTIKDTSAAGTPTYAVITATDGGAFNITLDNTSEVQNVCLYQNDILVYDWARIQWVEFVVSGPVAFVSNDTLFFGLANARNDAVASITEKVVFKLVAATSLTNIVIDSKDGTTAVSNTATGAVIGLATYKKYVIDFNNGLSDVRTYIDGARVAAGTKLDMSGLTAGNNCQIIAQLQKASGTTVPQVNISRVAIRYTIADGV